MTPEAVELERLQSLLRQWCVARTYYVISQQERWRNRKRLADVQDMYLRAEERLLEEALALLDVDGPVL